MSAKDFFETLRAHCQAGEFDEMAAMCRYPVSVTRSQPIQVFTDATEAVAAFRARWESNRRLGCVSYRVDLISHTQSPTGLHFVDVVWSLYDADDVKGVEYPASYILTKEPDGSFLVTSLIAHENEDCRTEAAKRMAILDAKEADETST